MKKYFFVFSLFSILATVACDTLSKGTATQAAPVSQRETVATPVAVVADTTGAAMPSKKGYSKKAMKAEMAPMNKAEMLRGGEDAPVKKQ